jgi:hypothetical protein
MLVLVGRRMVRDADGRTVGGATHGHLGNQPRRLHAGQRLQSLQHFLLAAPSAVDAAPEDHLRANVLATGLAQIFDFFSHCREQRGGKFGIAFLGSELLAICVYPIQEIT